LHGKNLAQSETLCTWRSSHFSYWQTQEVNDFVIYGKNGWFLSKTGSINHKYRDKAIGLILSVGPGALDFAVKLRAAVWPAVPVEFTAVDEEAAAKNQLPPRTTGIVIRRTLATMLKAAQAVVPNLKRLAVVGDRFEQNHRFTYRDAALYPQLGA
jgi:hypothetical protein